MQNYSIQELGVFLSVVVGGLGGMCLILNKSKCKSMNLCCGLISLERKLDKDLEPEEEDMV